MVGIGAGPSTQNYTQRMVTETRRGAHIPQGPKAPATSQTSSGVRRIYADRPLPKGMDALLTPQDFKQLNSQGYLDCAMSSNTMESNEGFLTLSSKLAACIVGPSRSIGAIGIDPLFMEMIKDPNAQAGFGYTRVTNETLKVLPGPVADPEIQQAERPRPAQHVKIPPLINPNDPTPQPQQISQTEPVQGVRPSTPGSGQATVSTNFNNRETTEMSTQQGTIQQTANSLNGFVDGRVIKVTEATVESSVLGGPMINGPDAEMLANGETAPIASELLTRARERLVNTQINLPEGQKFKGDSHNKHQETLRNEFGVQVEFAANNRYLFAHEHKVVWAGEGEPSAQDQQFINAANNLFTSENVSVLRANENPLPQSAKTKIDNVVNSMNLPEGEQAALRQKLYDYAQSYVDARSATMSFEFKVETPADRDQLQAWVTHLETQPGGVPENFEAAYSEAKQIIHNFDNGDAGAISDAIGQNINNLDRPGVERSPVGEGGSVEIKEGTVEYMEQLIDQQVTDLGAAGKSPSEVPMPAYQRVLNAEGQETIIKRPEAGQSLPEGFSAVESPLTDSVTLADWVNSSDGQPGLLRQAVVGNASTPVLVDTGQNGVTNAALLQSAQGNLGMLTELVKDPSNLNPQTIDAFESKINEQITELKERGLTTEAAALESGLQALNLPDVKTKATESMDEKLAARSIIDGLEGGFLEQAGNSLDKFQDYAKSAVRDGKITYEERDTMRSFVTESMSGMQNFLAERGVVGENATRSDMFALTAEDLTSKGFSPVEADQVLGTLDRLQSAHATVNVTSEGTHAAGLYERVQQLNRSIDEFEQIGVIKTAFRGEMKEAAENNPEGFNAMMIAAYNLPDDASRGPALVALRGLAERGELPFPPNVGFTDRSNLGGANGAYLEGGENGPTILLARDLMNNPNAMRDVFAEEMFHHMESLPAVQEVFEQDAENRVRQALQETHPDLPDDAPLTSLPEGASGDAISAFNDLQAARSRQFDAQGDEGRAGLNALKLVRGGESDADVIQAAGDGGRVQRANLTGEQMSASSEKFDQGTLNRPIFSNTTSNHAVQISKPAENSAYQISLSGYQTGQGNGNVTLSVGVDSSGALDPNGVNALSTQLQEQLQLPPEAAGRAAQQLYNQISSQHNPSQAEPVNNGAVVALPEVIAKAGSTAEFSTQPSQGVSPTGGVSRPPVDRTGLQIPSLNANASRATRVPQETLENNLRVAFNLPQNAPLPNGLPPDASPAQRTAWQAYQQDKIPDRNIGHDQSTRADNYNPTDPSMHNVQAEYDTEKGFGAKLGEMLINGLPDGLRIFGLKLANHAEKMKAIIAKEFASVANRSVQDQGKGLMQSSGMGSELFDQEASVGRGANYRYDERGGASQINHSLDPNRFRSHTNTPDYIEDEQKLAREEGELRQALQLGPNDSLPNQLPEHLAKGDTPESKAAIKAWNTYHTPTASSVSGVVQASDNYRSHAESKGILRQRS